MTTASPESVTSADLDEIRRERDIMELPLKILMRAFLTLNEFIDVYEMTKTNKDVVTFTKYILAFVNNDNDLRDK